MATHTLCNDQSHQVGLKQLYAAHTKIGLGHIKLCMSIKYAIYFVSISGHLQCSSSASFKQIYDYFVYNTLYRHWIYVGKKVKWV